MQVTIQPATDKSADARICLVSQRHLERHVSRCAEYEFEDIICEVDDADVLALEARTWYRSGQRAANGLARHTGIVCRNLAVKPVSLHKDYDALVAICQQPSDLPSLKALRRWKEHCRTSVCWLVELWAWSCHHWRNHLKTLRQFDHVIVMYSGSVQPLENTIGKRCVYMPPGIDAVTFCPYPNPPERCVDVFSIGRRSQQTHEALLGMARQGKTFYIYDTTRPLTTFCPKEHRAQMANIAKRSRYFITNAPKINHPSETRGQNEISYRFVEGAASGAVMIGESGDSEAFRTHIDWPDAVIRVPYEATDIAGILADLDSQPARLAGIRKDGIVNSLLRHDWVYRWRAMLDMLGLKPRPALVAREKRLAKLAEQVASA